jgi:hypothetical protein
LSPQSFSFPSPYRGSFSESHEKKSLAFAAKIFFLGIPKRIYSSLWIFLDLFLDANHFFIPPAFGKDKKMPWGPKDALGTIINALRTWQKAPTGLKRLKKPLYSPAI